MARVQAQVCEVKVDGAWMQMGLSQAHRLHRDALKRCPACHGRVKLFGHHLRVARPTMRHVDSHDGCPLTPGGYRGTPSPHPQAIG